MDGPCHRFRHVCDLCIIVCVFSGVKVGVRLAAWGFKARNGDIKKSSMNVRLSSCAAWTFECHRGTIGVPGRAHQSDLLETEFAHRPEYEL